MTAPTTSQAAYQEGLCDVFAVALHDELGYQPVAVRAYFKSRTGKVSYETPHVAARLPDGRLVDSLGITTANEMASRRWYFSHDIIGVGIVDVSRSQAGKSMGHAPSAAEVHKARQVIRNSLNLYTLDTTVSVAADVRKLLK